MIDPVGSYVVRVKNYAGWTRGRTPSPSRVPIRTRLQEETWTLSCESPEGTTRSARQVFVARGERRTLDLRGDCRSPEVASASFRAGPSGDPIARVARVRNGT